MQAGFWRGSWYWFMFLLFKRSSVCGINPGNPNPRLATFLDSIATSMPPTLRLAGNLYPLFIFFFFEFNYHILKLVTSICW